ncbi:hypothetical protein DUI87_22880 [Hirundo rustica rustica]|uniref:Uncharacterized protein n=1 Tax=Hirundo rustica rustica TaxID=333673 RepID=A0A3M0JHA3_HIRRU|nr:hypothetical protein DUI87_22880 [Hirundo rustica rustica]
MRKEGGKERGERSRKGDEKEECKLNKGPVVRVVFWAQHLPECESTQNIHFTQENEKIECLALRETFIKQEGQMSGLRLDTVEITALMN